MDRTTDSLFDICDHAITAICGLKKKKRSDLLKAIQTDLTGGSASGYPTAFTHLAVYLFYATSHQLTPSFSVFSTLKGNPLYFKKVKTSMRVFFTGKPVGRVYHDKEYLVDFYAASSGKKLAPLLTMESESKIVKKHGKVSHASKSWNDDIFHDFDKLLTVNSPRRIYFGRVSEGFCEEFFEGLSKRMDEAYSSQVLLRGDEIVVVMLVGTNKKNRIEMREYGSHSRTLGK
jgi:hypothetical protein